MPLSRTNPPRITIWYFAAWTLAWALVLFSWIRVQGITRFITTTGATQIAAPDRLVESIWFSPAGQVMIARRTGGSVSLEARSRSGTTVLGTISADNTERPVYAFERAGSKAASITNAELLITPLPSGAGFAISHIDPKDTPVASLSFDDNGDLVVQFIDSTIQVVSMTHGNHTRLEESGQKIAPCDVSEPPLVRNNIVVCKGKGDDVDTTPLLRSVIPNPLVSVATFHAGLDNVPLAISARGRVAAADRDGAIHILGAASQDTMKGVSFIAPGNVLALSFSDDDHLLALIEFRGIYSYVTDGSSAKVRDVPDGTTLLAATENQFAYASVTGPVNISSIDRETRISRTGWAILGAGVSVYFIVIAGLLYQRFRRRSVYEQFEQFLKVPSPIETPVELPVPDPPKELVNALARNECMLFAGAGLSAEAGLLTWGPFVGLLLATLQSRNLIDPERLPSLQAALRAGQFDQVAAGIANAMEDKKEQLYQIIRDLVQSPSGKLPPAHELLAGMPFSAVLTTNFDTLLEQAFTKNGAPDLFTPLDSEQVLNAIGRQNRFFVFKLYGDPSRAETMLVAPTDFNRQVVVNSLFASCIASIFETRTLLFIGASLEGIENYLTSFTFAVSGRRTHYALVNVRDAAWELKRDNLRTKFNIQVLPFTLSAPGTELNEFLEKLDGQVKETLKTLVPAKDESGLSKLSLVNIGPFEKLDIEFDRKWTVLLGNNGVGKSTILEAIAVAVCGQRAKRYARRLIRAGDTTSATIRLTMGGVEYITDLINDPNEEFGVKIVTSPHSDKQPFLQMAGSPIIIGFPPLRTVTDRPPDAPQALEGTARPAVEDILPLLGGQPDPRLDKLKQWIVNIDAAIDKGEKRYAGLIEKLFDSISKLTKGMKLMYQGVDARRRIHVQTDDGRVPIESVSQGTQSLLGWVGVLLQRLYEIRSGDPEPPEQGYFLVLLDEIDAHMHPAWQQRLTPRLSDIFQNAQFIVTTHSPFIVANMDPAQVIPFTRDENGRVQRVPSDERLKGMRIDQILTLPIFGLDSARDLESAEALATYNKLSVKDEDKLTPQEKDDLAKAMDVLNMKPHPAERLEARRASELIEEAAKDRIASLPEEVRAGILRELRIQTEESITGERRPE